MRVAHNDGLVANPDFLAIIPPHPVVNVKEPALFPRVLAQGLGLIQGIQVLPPEAWIGEAVFRLVAQDGRHLRAHIEKWTEGAGFGDIRDRRHLLDELPILGLRFLKR